MDHREPRPTPHDLSEVSATDGAGESKASDIVGAVDENAGVRHRGLYSLCGDKETSGDVAEAEAGRGGKNEGENAPKVRDTEAGHEDEGSKDAPKVCNTVSSPRPVVPPTRIRSPNADTRNDEPAAAPPVGLSVPPPSIISRPPSAIRPGTTCPSAAHESIESDVGPGSMGPDAGPTTGDTEDEPEINAEVRPVPLGDARAQPATRPGAVWVGPVGGPVHLLPAQRLTSLRRGIAQMFVGSAGPGAGGDEPAAGEGLDLSVPFPASTVVSGLESSATQRTQSSAAQEPGAAIMRPRFPGVIVENRVYNGRPIPFAARRSFMARHKNVIIGALFCAVIVAAAVSAAVVKSREKVTASQGQPPEETERFAAIKDALTAALGNTASALSDPSSPQHQALAWLADEDSMQVDWRDTEHLKQRFALATLFFSTDGEIWADDFNFLSREHECGWNKEVPMYDFGPAGGGEEGLGIPYKGALCLDDNTTVNVLVLPENNLTGHLPEEIGLLRGLHVLGLWSNMLRGTLPSTLGNIHYLKILGLFLNLFTGTVPSSLGYLSQLETLALHFNGFKGTIPQTLGKLSNLKTFALGISHGGEMHLFSGTFPSFINNLASLEVLFLCGTQLSGTLPFTSGSLPQLRRIVLYGNRRLTGSIPEAIYSYHILEQLDMERTSLTGTLSSAIGNLASLKIIHFRDAHLSGTLPAAIKYLDQLEELWLEGNSFSGTLPPEMGRLKKLTDVRMGTNWFTGTLPKSIGNLTSLQFLNLMENQFNGTVPRSLLNLRLLDGLYLQNNSFSGDISFLCNNSIGTLLADCFGDSAEVFCGGCCAGCCGDDLENGPIEGCYPP